VFSVKHIFSNKNKHKVIKNYSSSFENIKINTFHSIYFLIQNINTTKKTVTLHVTAFC
jgi:hypothetical protein